MKYPIEKITPPRKGMIRWVTSKDRTGNAMMNKQRRAKVRLRIANNSRKINRAKARM